MTRDKFKSFEFWDEKVQFATGNNRSMDAYSLFKEKIDSTGDDSSFNLLFHIYALRWIHQVAPRYNRGDELSAIKLEIVDEGVERYLKVAEELELYRSKVRLQQTQVFTKLLVPHHLQDAYTLLSWFICFDTDADKLSKLAPFIAPEGCDRILDTILARYQPDRVVAESCACPRTHRLLESLFDASNEKQEELCHRYLDRWARLMSSLNGKGILNGASRAEGAKSNADLVRLAEQTSYKGFWAFELAMIVRELEIDDSSFADHQLYPADLAHFNR